MTVVGLACICVFGSVTDIQSLLSDVLNGHASVTQVQSALAQTLGEAAVSESGIIVAGHRPAIRELPPGRLAEELGESAPVLHYFKVTGHGPDPLRIFVPIGQAEPDTGIYRRVEKGLFCRLDDPTVRRGNYLMFEVSWPGQFIVSKTYERSCAYPKGLFPVYPEPSTDPSLKRSWRLFRMAAAEVNGPIPLLLIHGAGANRWGEFIHWARFSPEAAQFREHYRLWDFSHNMYAINAAIGLRRDFPMFEESIVAYLKRFMDTAHTEGVLSEGDRYYFPDGPFSIFTSSHGALTARAFMINFPEYGDRVLGVVTLGGPHTGTPWATPEWIRYTASRLGVFKPTWAERIAWDAFTSNYVSDHAQSDLDMGWANFDAQGGFGLPHRGYLAWMEPGKTIRRVISPRDAYQTGARTWPGYEDDTSFEPDPLLETYCGGLEAITPQHRGEMYMDRFFLYGTYIQRGRGWWQLVSEAGNGVMDRGTQLYENTALRITNIMMGFVESEGAAWPMSPYRMSDGFVPLQSQLALDGKETEPVFKTCEILGWRVPVIPFEPDMLVIREHTLANPDRLRLLPGWSHLDTVTGHYNKETLHSELFYNGCH